MNGPPATGPPAFVYRLLGWKPNGVPNIADASSTTSVAVATGMLNSLNITRQSNEAGHTLGTMLEAEVADELETALPGINSYRTWDVRRNRNVTAFSQYAHLARIDELVREHPALRADFGSDYVVSPDVTVGVGGGSGALMLHASVSCKFTIRSDRVQNIRHEGIVLTRHRRGRQPHIVVVTAEPLPSRLASIARGTGEVDRAYHVALPEMTTAVAVNAPPDQQNTFDELRSQDRLDDFDAFLRDIATG